ncbi:MAG: PaeR7I family type II restriction endonuclease [Actinobacteria bacterium]|nr:PaeR7I family type II restriction endonuclease [Actinomycetota bacterium]
MSLNLVNYDQKAKEAVKAFWGNRAAALQKQVESGKADQGQRGAATAGKNMDGFLALIIDVVHANGLQDAEIHVKKSALTLPGYYRATKLWDLIITFRGRLVAGIELKSQVGPSFGNNFNNRTEEAIGTASDFWVAYREGAFGEIPPPFTGWIILVEDCADSNSPVRTEEPHYSVFPEFKGSSYLKRYDLLCQKLMLEKQYTAASLIASERNAVNTGEYSSLTDMTSLHNFIASLAGHISIVAQQIK